MTKFKVITPAYNCENKIAQTIISVVGQSYKNWEMVICNDMSTDNTSEVIKSLADKMGCSDKITVKDRITKHGEVKNTLVESNASEDDEVIVRLDAGDWLTDLGCFHYLDQIYQHYDPAVLWTAHRWSFTDTNISGDIDRNTSLYEQPWKTSHLKTFRNTDFKGLNKKNFLDDNGDYIMIACDQAVFLPMLERARRNGRQLLFFPRVMYHYDINLKDPELFSCDRSQNQKMSAEKIRERGFIE